MTESPDMNGAATVQHLEQVRAAYPGKRILLFWDCACRHNGPLVRELLAANSRLEMLQFPVAAPDLNPQAHVWKATHRAISHNHARRRLPELADNFTTHLGTRRFMSSFLDRHGFSALRPRFT